MALWPNCQQKIPGHENQGGLKYSRQKEHINRDELFSTTLSEIDQDLQKFDSTKQILRVKY